MIEAEYRRILAPVASVEVGPERHVVELAAMEGLVPVAERYDRMVLVQHDPAQVCGVLNATTGPRQPHRPGARNRVVAGMGIRSASHWVAWKCGVSPPRARTLVVMARRLGELLQAGEHESSSKPVPGDVDWADSLVAMADVPLAGPPGRTMSATSSSCTWAPMETGTTNGHLHSATG